MNEKSLGILASKGDWSNGDIDKDGVLGNGELLEEVITRGWITLGIRTTLGGEIFFGSSCIIFILLSLGSLDGIWLVVEFTSSIFGVKVTENTFKHIKQFIYYKDFMAWIKIYLPTPTGLHFHFVLFLLK